MRTMWKGSIQFGLVYIPIKLYTATENKDIRLRMLHKDCMAPINYTRTCSKCGQAIENDAIVKGYEYAPGQFVPISEEELSSLQDETDKHVEIINFVKLSEIDPIYYEKSYFIGPDSGNGLRAFSLLRQAIQDSDKIAIANIIIRSKQHLAAIRSFENGMLLETLYYPDEVRSIKEVPGIGDLITENEPKEMTIANQLIEQLTTEFKPDHYKDDYRLKMEKLIEDKVAGMPVEKKKGRAAQPNVVDLLSALEASVKETKPKPRRKTATKRKKTV
ncbi:non-homologous end joining protein Ku [Sporolactobacillus inulinus]|uniref:Non-homologous end joining protein Ku n=2 Tax=Sporolactobacillus inulinus TaxID=2078 RepID=A0A4Y3T2I9_9BACL|nr:Ku protein [Sporolactobacillus inulinus]KLI02324.1 DNA repair protein [Sporolactobacillus inulinus CASD]GAY75064.1 Ku domain protein [Sporolactobacillus inulinus]GEB75663.1 non-homologous end joining protein Ku [Sporolactobacillus inulinus]